MGRRTGIGVDISVLITQGPGRLPPAEAGGAICQPREPPLTPSLPPTPVGGRAAGLIRATLRGIPADCRRRQTGRLAPI